MVARPSGRRNTLLSACALFGAAGLALSPLGHAAASSHAQSPATKAKRDSCLVGVWYVSDYTTFFSSLFKTMTVTGVTGTQGIRFNKNGTATVVANHFTINMTANDTHLPWQVSLVGEGSADWKTPRKGLVKFANIEGDYTETISIAGKTGTATPSGAFGTGAQTYVCSKTQLQMYPAPSHPAVVFTRKR